MNLCVKDRVERYIEPYRVHLEELKISVDITKVFIDQFHTAQYWQYGAMRKFREM